MTPAALLEQLNTAHRLEKPEWEALIAGYTPELAEEAALLALLAREPYKGKRVYNPGIIE